MSRDYDKFHKMLADRLGIEVRDLMYIRATYYDKGYNIQQIAHQIQKRLPRVKGAKSWRYQVYLKRLAFLAKMTEEQFNIAISEITNYPEFLEDNKKRAN